MGHFCEVLIFVIFVVDPVVTKILHPRKLILSDRACAARNSHCGCGYVMLSDREVITKTKEMALYRRFRPVDGVLDPKGPLLCVNVMQLYSSRASS